MLSRSGASIEVREVSPEERREGLNEPHKVLVSKPVSETTLTAKNDSDYS